MPEAPKVETVLIDRPNEHPLGAGEASQGPTAAAIANAFAAATGKRLRELPFTPRAGEGGAGLERGFASSEQAAGVRLDFITGRAAKCHDAYGISIGSAYVGFALRRLRHWP